MNSRRRVGYIAVCPVCRELERLYMHEERVGGRNLFGVKCGRCGFKISLKSTVDAAIRDWDNYRSPAINRKGASHHERKLVASI